MNIVRETRTKLKWTQKRLADELGKHLRTIVIWESMEEIQDPLIVRAMNDLWQDFGSPSDSGGGK